MLSVEQLKTWLKEAKDAHTVEFGHDPDHDWISYYADHMFLNYLQKQIREASGVMGLIKFRQQNTKAVPVMHTGNPNKVISDFISAGTIKTYRNPNDDGAFDHMDEPTV